MAGQAGKIFDLIARTKLRQMAALLTKCGLFIGNDTGAMHIAAAMKVPVIEISSWSRRGYPLSANAPTRFRPWKTRHCILTPDSPIPPCRYHCFSEEAHCIKKISVDDVKNAILKFRQENL